MSNRIEFLDSQLDKNLTPKTLEAQYRNGDFLNIGGLKFTMSHYSYQTVGKDKQQSRFVEYAGCGLTIALDFLRDTIEIYES